MTETAAKLDASNAGTFPVRAFDFRSPCRLSLHVESLVRDWQNRSARLLPQKWLAWLPWSANWTCPSAETVVCAALEIPDHCCVFQVPIVGQAQPTLLLFPGDFAVALVLSVLGQAVTAMEDPRELTSIECAMLELLVEQTLIAINEGGEGAGYPTCGGFQHLARPVPLKIFPLEKNLVVLRYAAAFPWGAGTLQWIWPESLIETLFVEPQPLADVSDDESRILSSVALRLPFEIRVELGTIRLHISELANLQAGDLLVLDQRIHDPLNCRIGNDVVLKAWPTVTGTKQSIQIVSVES